MKIGPVCKTVELIKRESFEYKIVDDLEQISFLFNILQKEQLSLSVRLSRNITTQSE